MRFVDFHRILYTVKQFEIMKDEKVFNLFIDKPFPESFEKENAAE